MLFYLKPEGNEESKVSLFHAPDDEDGEDGVSPLFVPSLFPSDFSEEEEEPDGEEGFACALPFKEGFTDGVPGSYQSSGSSASAVPEIEAASEPFPVLPLLPSDFSETDTDSPEPSEESSEPSAKEEFLPLKA